jgi:beta-lactamase superfamily II metal-dependent hydrolase
MAWSLEIHQIDVGQGDSTLIIAKEDSNPNAVVKRGMLIDAGRGGQAQVVDDYIASQLDPADLKAVVVSSYDADHSGGIIDLLRADAIWEMVKIIEFAINSGINYGTNLTTMERFVVVAASVSYACLGGYATTNYTTNLANLQFGCLDYYRKHTPGTPTEAKARKIGFDGVLNFLGNNFNVVVVNAILRSNTLAIAKSTRNSIIPDAITKGSVDQYVRADIIDYLWSRAKVNRKRKRGQGTTTPPLPFETQDTYHNIAIYDIGLDKTANMSPEYEYAVAGNVLLSSTTAHVSNANLVRTRTKPALGAEIFWGNDTPPAVNPPQVYVWAINRKVRDGNSSATLTDTDDNAKSIGLVVKFNDFYYYLGGDLPQEAEEWIWDDLISNNARPWGNAKPDHICGFKAGHHGAKTSTSLDFLEDSEAKVCLISCGKNRQFDHPTDETINNLLDWRNAVQGFFLTGCAQGVANIPNANGVDQFSVIGNTAWVSGKDGYVDGHIHLEITANGSQGNHHTFYVNFQDVPPNSNTGTAVFFPFE